MYGGSNYFDMVIGAVSIPESIILFLADLRAGSFLFYSLPYELILHEVELLVWNFLNKYLAD